MLKIFSRILGARAVAAVLGLATASSCVALLPNAEYASASVAISYASVLSVVFYLPFSKYVLISGDSRSVESVFWIVQPWVAVILVVAVAAFHFTWAYKIHGSAWLMLAAAVLVLSQGWKEFCGELLRVRSNIPAVQKLFVLDALCTLALSAVAVFVFRTAESMLLASAVSSMFWAIFYLPKRELPATGSTFRTLFEVYRYSVGVVGTNTLNTGLIAGARTFVLKSASPQASAGIQFLLDMLQKPMALVASSVNSTVIPILRSGSLNKVLWPLLGVMIASLVALAVLALLVGEASGLLGLWKNERLPLGVAMSCAFFIWSNRYKTSVLDLPLTVSNTHTNYLLIGGATSFFLVTVLASTHASPQTILTGCGIYILLGGVISCCIGWRARLVGPADIALSLAPAILAACVVLAL